MFPKTKSTCAFAKTGYIATAQNYNFLSSDINTWRRLRQRQELLQQVLIVPKSILFCWFTIGITMIHLYFQTWYGTPELFVEKKFLICLVPSAIKIVICLFKWSWTNVQSVLFHLLTIESIKRSSWPSWEKIQTHAIKPLVSPKFVMDLTFLQISRNSFCALEAWWCFQLNW